MTFDGKAFGAEIVVAVKSHVSATVEPLLARIDALENRLESLPEPKDGKSVTDIDVSLTDEGRTAVFTFMLGEVEHSFEVPLVPGPKGEKGDPGKDGRD